jgi:ElaB/YqjD/DUF883 family membrane-anchored ribosome-binding protein
MFKANKWEQWYDNLPAHTKEYLKKQAVWNDVDMFKAFAIGATVGLLIGLIL